MKTALLLVDAQRNMLEGDFPIPAAAQIKPALESLLTRGRKAGALVVHVQNDGPPGEPDEPGTVGWELIFPAAEAEIVVRKGVPDAFAANTDLASDLRASGVKRVVVAGMQSNYCVAATSLGALENGFEVVLASGAHATYDEKESAATISEKVEDELGRGPALTSLLVRTAPK